MSVLPTGVARRTVFPVLLAVALVGCGILRAPSMPPLPPLPQLGIQMPVAGLLSVYADAVHEVAPQTLTIHGVEVDMRMFEVQAQIYAQICEDLFGEGGCDVPAPGQFLIGVGRDGNGSVCRGMQQAIKDYWLHWERSGYTLPESIAGLPSEKHVHLVGSDFVLYEGGLSMGEPLWLFYALGEVIRIESFDDYGFVSRFAEDNTVLSIHGREYRPPRKSRIRPRAILELIQEGKLDCSVH